MAPDISAKGLIPGLIDLTAGSFGAVASSMVGYPLDTIKLKIQTFPHLYRSSFDCFRKTIRQEGIPGFYRGIYLGMKSDVVEKSVLFCSFGYCQRTVCRFRGHQKPSILDEALAGFFAAFFSTLAMSPIDLLKCRLQTLTERKVRPSMSAFQLISKIFEEEGLKGFYKGFNSTLAREMFGYFFYFGGYGLAKQALNVKEGDKMNLFKTLMAGGFGGVCLWVSIFPIDLVKSIVQVDSNDDKMITIIMKIVKKQGIRGLYRGLTPTLIRSFLSSAALFVTYENSKQYLTKVVDNKSSNK